MATFVDPLKSLLGTGRVTLTSRPAASPSEQAEIDAILAERHEAFSLQVAGPPLRLHVETARAASEVVLQACWFLVSDIEPQTELERCLVMPRLPQSPEQHLSGDLLFRFLPQIHQRARAIDRNDKLPALLADILRRWPLSGVLADIEEPPLGSTDFGHAGLQLLYAERLAQHERPACLPKGDALEYVEFVWQELGKRLGNSDHE